MYKQFQHTTNVWQAMVCSFVVTSLNEIRCISAVGGLQKLSKVGLVLEEHERFPSLWNYMPKNAAQ